MKKSNVPVMYPFRTRDVGEGYKLEFYLDYGCESRVCFCVYYKNIISGKYVGMFKMKLK